MSQELVRRNIVKNVIRTVIVASLVAAAVPVVAQEAPPRQAPGRQVPLRVQVVVTRLQGEKKISSMPYTLSVVANDGDKTSMRMGVDVPIPSTVFTPAEGGKATTPVTSYNYRSVGTNIDCQARTIDEGLFKLTMAVEDSSVGLIDKDAGNMPRVNAPAIRHFRSQFNLLMRDGQTLQHTAATDPVSGEVLRVDVTLTVLK